MKIYHIEMDIEKNGKKDFILKSKKIKSIGFCKLFSYSTRSDVVLILIGMIASVGMGLAWPLVIYFFGDVTKTFMEFLQYSELLKRQLLKYNESVPKTAKLEHIVKRLRYYDPSFTMNEKGDIIKIVTPLCQYFAEIALAMLLLSYVSISCLTISAQNQITKIRIAFFRAVMRQNIGWFDEQSSGSLNNNLVDEINFMHDGIGQKAGQMIVWLSCGIGALILAFVKDWKLTLVCLAMSPVIALTMCLLTRIMNSLNKNESIAYGKAGAIAEEVLGSVKTVVAFNGEKYEVDRYTKNLDFACQAGKRKGIFAGIIMGLLSGLIFGSFSLGFWYGGKRIREENQNVGDALVIFFSCMLASIGFGQAFPHFSALNRAQLAASTIFEIVARIPEIDKMSENGHKLAKMAGNIEFRNVHFRYPVRPECAVLKGVYLSAMPGQTIALVGASGCGKSSIIHLIQRFYDVTGGKILIDDNNIDALNVMWLREQIGVVSQEPILFACSIKDNIRYGRLDVTDDEIEVALVMANADKFVKELPNRLDTILGDRGAQLSGGQKQRIAIARALVRNPKILLLDEATSALDSESESRVQRALDNARIGRTTIIIAHRLSTIKNADVIFCVKDGQVIESGSHEELLAMDGHYKGLVERQKIINNEDKFDESRDEEHSTFEENRILSDDKVILQSAAFETESKMILEGHRNYFVKVMKLNFPEKWFIVLGCIGALINGASPPLFSILFGYLIPAMGEQDLMKQEKSIERYVSMMCGLAIITFFANVIQGYAFSESGEKLTKRCRSLTFKAMLSQDMSWFDQPTNSTGVLTTRLSDEASSIRGVSGESFGLFCQAISSIGVALVISLIYTWQIALATLAFIPFILIGGYLQVRTMKGPSDTDMKALEESGKIAMEGIENIRTVTNLTREKTFIDDYEKKIVKLLEDLSMKSHLQAVLFGITQSTVLCAYSATFLVAGHLIKENLVEMDKIYIAFGALIFGALFFGGSFAMGPKFGRGIIAAKNMFSLLDSKSGINSYSDDGIEIPLDNVQGLVEFKEVYFRYPVRPDVTVLKNIIINIKPNTTVALVGQSGCGKSTIVQLLQRLYDINSGVLEIDNTNIREIKISNLRNMFGLVSQEPVLFSYSIKENIAYADSEGRYNTKQIESAAEAANIHDFIMNLPDKYGTLVGEKGVNLSGGQKQRIAIARALLRNPRILLLDEATSALDTESEKLVQDALDRAQEGRTCIVIAHRLSTIQNADQILVLDGGKIAEMGTHNELIKKKGLYSNMINNI